MGTRQAQDPRHARVLRVTAALLAAWAAVGFGFFFFARDLQVVVAGWPLGYWMGAQGAVLAFIGIVAVYAAVMNRLFPEDSEPTDESAPHA